MHRGFPGAQQNVEERRRKKDEKEVARQVVTDADVNRTHRQQRRVKDEWNQKHQPFVFALLPKPVRGPERGSYREGQKGNGSFEEKGDRKIVPPTVVTVHPKQPRGMSDFPMMSLPVNAHQKVGWQYPAQGLRGDDEEAARRREHLPDLFHVAWG